MAYQWKNKSLQSKNKKYSWSALAFMVLAIISVLALPTVTEYFLYITFISMVVAFILMMLSWRVQSDDKKLKAKK